jgi:hypothetical protein
VIIPYDKEISLEMNCDLFAIEADGADALLCRAIRICEQIIAFVMKDAKVKERVLDDVGTEINNTRTWLLKLRTSVHRTQHSRDITLILESLLKSLQHLEEELRRVAHMSTIGFWFQTDPEKVTSRLHLNNIKSSLELLVWRIPIDISIKTMTISSEFPGFSKQTTLMDYDERTKGPLGMAKKDD